MPAVPAHSQNQSATFQILSRCDISEQRLKPRSSGTLGTQGCPARIAVVARSPTPYAASGRLLLYWPEATGFNTRLFQCQTGRVFTRYRYAYRCDRWNVAKFVYHAGRVGDGARLKVLDSIEGLSLKEFFLVIICRRNFSPVRTRFGGRR